MTSACCCLQARAWLETSRSRTSFALRMLLQPPAQATVIWKKTCDEVAAGYCEALLRRLTLTIFGGSALGPRSSVSPSSKGILLGGPWIMAGREGRTRLRWRTRVVHRPAQLFSASSATSWESRWLESWSSVKAQKTLPRRFVKFHFITTLSVTMLFVPGHGGCQMAVFPDACHAIRPHGRCPPVQPRISFGYGLGAERAFLVWGSTTTFKHSELLASVPSARDAFTDLITWLGLITDPQEISGPDSCSKVLGYSRGRFW